ncbi:hypothetical protein MMC07_007704 [Pseudocyphellaria aurata]|nr:hypothetical protein [Pseudocyphellaria aurata]
MQFSRFLFLLAFSTLSTLATPVPDEPNFESGVTLSANPLDRDLFGDSTNQRPPEDSSSKSASQIFASDYDAKDSPFQADSAQSVDLPRKSAGDFSNIQLTYPLSTNPLPISPPDQQSATGNSPDKAEVSSKSFATSDALTSWVLRQWFDAQLKFEGEDCYSPSGVMLAGTPPTSSHALDGPT